MNLSIFSRVKRPITIRRVLVRLVLWYIFVMVLLFFAQRHLLYRPGKLTAAQFTEQVSQRFEGKTQILSDFDAVVVEPSSPATRTAILFHGNGGNGIDRYILENDFSSRGYRLVLAEYPGYAARSGSPAEPTIVEDAHALYRDVLKRFPNEPVTLVGESLGTGVATQVAATAAVPPAALVLITPYHSMTEVAQKQVPLFPATLILRDRYESGKVLPGYRGEVRIMVADQDELLGVETGLALFKVAKARGPAKLLRLPTAGHNTWVFQLTSQQWDELLGPRPATRPTQP